MKGLKEKQTIIMLKEQGHSNRAVARMIGMQYMRFPWDSYSSLCSISVPFLSVTESSIFENFPYVTS